MVLTETPSGVRPWHLAILLAIVIALFVVGTILGGEFGAVMAASITGVPFALLAALAYLGVRYLWARILAVIVLVSLVGAYAVYAFTLAVLAKTDIASMMAGVPQFAPDTLPRLLGVMFGIALAIVAGAVVALPPVRRAIARITPLDPTSFVHTMALVLAVTFTILGVVPLIVFGVPPLLAVVDQFNQASVDLTSGRGDSALLRDQVYGLVWIIPSTIVAVGFGTSRSLRDCLARLGLVRPSLKQIGIGLGVGVALVIAVQGLSFVISAVFQFFGWPETDGQLFEQLIAGALNPVGAVVIGVTAGLGEELAVRGVLQPRLGLVLSNLLFSLGFHGFQYGWDALIIVVLLGLVFGVVRQRTNTSTAAIGHGFYDFLVIILPTLGIEWLR